MFSSPESPDSGCSVPASSAAVGVLPRLLLPMLRASDHSLLLESKSVAGRSRAWRLGFTTRNQFFSARLIVAIAIYCYAGQFGPLPGLVILLAFVPSIGAYAGCCKLLLDRAALKACLSCHIFCIVALIVLICFLVHMVRWSLGMLSGCDQQSFASLFCLAVAVSGHSCRKCHRVSDFG